MRLESVSVRDDGACQFRAFSQQLYGKQDYHLTVRLAVVSYMEAEASFFRPMFAEGEFATYLSTMRQPRSWGDELTLRAFADCFQVQVHVVTSTDENWYMEYVPQGNAPPRKHVFL